MVTRTSAVAGSMYAGTRDALRRQIEECFLHRAGVKKIPKVNPYGPRKIVGLISPHAGYIYSGPVAANSYSALAEDGAPEIAVILGPNHTGMGSALSIMTEGRWKTPLGEIEIESDTALQIVKLSNIINIESGAHKFEHSIEMQLPFLQYLFGEKIRLIPICMMMQDLETSRDVGKAVAKALQGKNAVIIASTDMSHYEPYNIAKSKDSKAINEILKLDEESLMRTVTRLSISMCGPGPVTSCIVASKELDGQKARLLKYSTSGDISGDLVHIVGYASISIEK